MGSDKGVLARAIAGGFKGGTAALRQTDELTEKFAWGDEVARKERQANLDRFGYQKKLVTHNLTETERMSRKQEADKIRNRMQLEGRSKEEVESAVAQATRGGETASGVLGSPAKKLSLANRKIISEITKDVLGEDADAETKAAFYNAMVEGEAGGEAGTWNYAEVKKKAEKVRDTLAKKETLINATSSGLTSTFNTDTAKGQASFAKLVAKNPDVARATLDRMKRDKSVQKVEIQQMERILASGGVEEGVMDLHPRSSKSKPFISYKGKGVIDALTSRNATSTIPSAPAGEF